MSETARKIIKAAVKEGFTGVGSTPVTNADISAVERWLSKGCNASMDYMTRNLDIRENPALLLENARSMFVFTIPYPRPLTGKSGEKYAGFALGKDYHHIIKDKLHNVAGEILDKQSEYRVFCDSAPVMERYWAAQCGLGGIGKNNFLISKTSGARVLIGEILTNEIFDDEVSGELRDWNSATATVDFNPETCIECDKCIRACPNGALKGYGMLDAARCISYNTIENKESMPEGLDTRGWVLGCEECLLACPFCQNGDTATDDEFRCNALFLSVLGKEGWSKMDTSSFRQRFKGTAFERPGLEKIKSNIK